MNYEILIDRALNAREKAYAPYSKFKVGAAVLMKNGEIFTGCNIENSSFGATNCAERTAIFKAVSEGNREITALALVGSLEDYTYPCGICRQVIGEFSTEKTEIILIKNKNDYIIKKFSELMPCQFGKSSLEKN